MNAFKLWRTKPGWLSRVALGGLLLAVAFPAYAQTGVISGRVTDPANDQPIRGVRVVIVGTNLQATTRPDGLYTLTGVPIGVYRVRAAVIGYSSVTARANVQAGVTSEIDFALKEARISLDALVVTGTAAAVSRREVGNSLNQITKRDIEVAPIQDVGDILQGRAAGVMVMDNSGMVGAGNTIRLRGTNSVTQGNAPLIYIDGVRMTNNAYQGDPEPNQAPSPLNDINPADIEHIEIIKGAAATTLYGTQAAGGVIQIFTKRGAQGAPRWTLGIEQGFNTAIHMGPDKSINPTGLGLNTCNTADDVLFPADSSCPASGSWVKKGYLHRYNASVRGGTGTVNYFISGRWGKESGVIDPQGSEDWSLRGNFGFAPSDVLTINFNTMYARRHTVWIPDGNNAEGLLLNVFRGENDYTGRTTGGHHDGDVLEMRLDQTSNHFLTGLTASWTPIPGMTHRVNVGLDFAESDYTEERPFGYFRVPLGNREDDEYQAKTLTLDYAGTWSTSLTSSVSSSFSAGGQLYQESFFTLNGFGDDFAGPGDKVLQNAARTEAFEDRERIVNGGFFFQEQIGLMDKLFLTAGIRFDGHSSFGSESGLNAYPKLSGAYTISDDSFWPSWWEGMKLRAAWGKSGKAPGIFDALRTWEAVAGDDAEPAVTPATLGEPDLGPEVTTEFEFGFEGSVFDGRLSFDFTHYDQTVNDALVRVQQIPSGGFVGTQLLNAGEFKNSGNEVQLDLTVLDSRSLGLDLGVRFATNNSKVLDLGGIENITLSFAGNKIRPCTGKEAELQLSYRDNVACPLPGYWGDVIVNDSGPLNLTAGPDGNTPVGTAPVFEERYLGPEYPTRTLGLNVSIRIGQRITLDALGEGHYGHVINSGTAYQNARRGVWPQCRNEQQLYDDAGKGSAGRALLTAWEVARCIRGRTTYGMWVQPADFFKLRQFSASFQLPGSWFPFARAAVLRLQGRNLLTITDYPGLDPETFEDGSRDFALHRQEYYNLPPNRTFIASLKFEF